jgi:hypothetical protein
MSFDDSLQALLNGAPPTFLFKYRGVTAGALPHLRRTFTHSEVYFASRVSFNDPFECRPLLTFEGTDEQLSDYLRKVSGFAKDVPAHEREARILELASRRDIRLPQFLTMFSEQWNQRLDRELGIFCMSARSDHILMWGHYADAHHGVCLVFDTRVENVHFRGALPVHYQTDYPSCSLIASSELDIYRSSIYTKATPWAYEEEWRSWDMRGGPGVRQFSSGCLVGVILGALISAEHRTLISKWAATHPTPVTVVRARLKSSEYGVEVMHDDWRVHA